jgi:SAM-dependent methyltransferase
MNEALNPKESRRPPRNVGNRSGFFLKLRRLVHLFADLQVVSVERTLGPWLAKQNGLLLEVGCGDQPYRPLVPSSCAYRGLDIADAKTGFDANSAPDVTMYSGGAFPFGDHSFDCLFHTDVIEHVYDYQFFLKECRRVLKADGAMFFAVPFQARYHYIPLDYWRFTPSSLKTLLEEAGFNDIVVKARGTDITVAMYKVAAVAFRWAYGGIFKRLAFVFLSPLTVILLIIAHLSMRLGLGSTDDCLGYAVTARA